MIYYPKRKVRFLKVHKKNKIRLIKHNSLLKYPFGIKVLSNSIITVRQFETLRRFISRRLNKKGKIFRRITLSLPITKKAENARMGKGRGNFNLWVAFVSPGTILFEFSGVSNLKTAQKDFKKIQTKMPFECKLVFVSLTFRSNL